MGDVIDLESRRHSTQDTSRSRRAETERREWLRVWAIAWEAESRRRGKTVPPSDRLRYAGYVKALIGEIQQREGSRSGKVLEALHGAAALLQDRSFLQARMCPEQLMNAARKREYRVDRFTSEDPKVLRGKLMDWLAVVEALGQMLGRSPQREVSRFHEDTSYRSQLGPPSIVQSGLAEQFEQVFSKLALDLRRICERVARQTDAPAYYDFCEKNHAAFHAGKLIPCDGWARRFNRFDFEPGGWIELEDGSYWDDPQARSTLGPIAEVLMHTPLARVSLGLVELVDHPELNGQFYPELRGEWLSLELDVHLVLRPDVEDPADAGALLIHPFIGLLLHSGDRVLQHDRHAWWSETGQVGVEFVQPAVLEALRAGAPKPTDQYQERALHTILNHPGYGRIEPLTRESCQTWLSFGANDVAPEFGPFFDPQPDGFDPDDPVLVSAPEGTLAGFLQMNLLTPDGSPNVARRLDRLLAADGARKLSEAERVLREKSEAYDRFRSASSAFREIEE